MRSLLDGKFSNLTKSQQALKLNKNDAQELKISIHAAENTILNISELQRRLKEISKFIFDKGALDWLESTKVFEDSYLKYLSTYKIPKLKLISNKDETQASINLEGNYSDLILLEVGLQSLLCETRFASVAAASQEELGYFYSFATDRFNTKAGSFFNSPLISIIEDGSAYRPDADFYSLQTILLPVNGFTYVGTTNPLISLTFGQPVVNFCDEERWFEGWPDQNFAPSEAAYDEEKHRGFYLSEPNFAVLNEVRTKHNNAIIISKELNSFEMAHCNSHFGNIVWLWSQDLMQDMNIEKYSAEVLWS